ncbi:MAG: hypothetical protein NVS1B13_19000 [Flavisolibacter sp.]
MSQDKLVLSTTRVFPKTDRTSQLEKVLAAHAQQYHKGDQSWKVYSIESGPDYGGYHITEGPSTWDGIDKRGNLGAAHTNDWNTNISPLLSERSQSSFSVYRPDLSTVKLTDYASKIMLTHLYPKPGYTEEVEGLIKKLKTVWEASGQSIAVYEINASGPTQFVIVTRYKQGLKEKERSFFKPMKERFTAANGEGSWDSFIQGQRMAVDHSWSELLYVHPDLSSK